MELDLYYDLRKADSNQDSLSQIAKDLAAKKLKKLKSS
jgi:predicted CopG family antitoxin